MIRECLEMPEQPADNIARIADFTKDWRRVREEIGEAVIGHGEILDGVLEGQAADLKIEAGHILRMRNRIYNVYDDQPGVTVEKIDEGLCNEILEHLTENTDAKEVRRRRLRPPIPA